MGTWKMRTPVCCALFKAVPADEKTRVRERLVQLFDVVGTADARTVKARAELTVGAFLKAGFCRNLCKAKK